MLIDFEIVKPAIRIAKESEDSLKMVVGLSLRSKVLKESIKCIYKTMTPLEDLALVDKEDLWNYVITNYPKRAKEEKIELCKSLYVIGSLF